MKGGYFSGLLVALMLTLRSNINGNPFNIDLYMLQGEPGGLAACEHLDMSVVLSELKNIKMFNESAFKHSSFSEKCLSGTGFLDQYLKERQLLLFIGCDWNGYMIRSKYKKFFDDFSLYNRALFFLKNLK